MLRAAEKLDFGQFNFMKTGAARSALWKKAGVRLRCNFIKTSTTRSALGKNHSVLHEWPKSLEKMLVSGHQPLRVPPSPNGNVGR